jgi:hypothetical protein
MNPHPAETRLRPEYASIANLIVGSTLTLLRRKVPGFETQLESLRAAARRSAYYPDGTLLLEGGDTFIRFRNLLIREQVLASGGVHDCVGFQSIDPFPDQSYALWIPEEYEDNLGEPGFHVWFPRLYTYPSREYRLDDFPITVVFKRKPKPAIQSRFVAILASWFRGVSKEGILGEGPLRSVSKEVQFRGTLAQLRVDASSSGQNTLNGLLLSVLTFGHEVSPVKDFIFDQEKHLELFVGGPLEDEIETIDLG